MTFLDLAFLWVGFSLSRILGPSGHWSLIRCLDRLSAAWLLFLLLWHSLKSKSAYNNAQGISFDIVPAKLLSLWREELPVYNWKFLPSKDPWNFQTANTITNVFFFAVLCLCSAVKVLVYCTQLCFSWHSSSHEIALHQALTPRHPLVGIAST